ncbi:sensor histidine kinase [Endothiovibrio diazotrophicus]
MSFELGPLFLAVVAYLGLLFLIAYAAENGRLPERLIRHPLTYTLSLGVYATSWTYYGSVGFAHREGHNYLTIYLGVTLAFLLWPLLLRPMLRLTRDFQLSSLADVFAFRYRSQLAGALVTLFMLIGLLPYIALQIRAVTQSIQVLTFRTAPEALALGFCAILVLFAVLFGARHATPRERHSGLVAAIAFESAVKLVAMLTVGIFALFGVFGGFQGLEQWLAAHPEALTRLNRPVHEGPWATLLLLAFAAAFLLPRQFHMLFTENEEEEKLRVAAWAFPLFLLALNLAIPPVLWAGSRLLPEMDPDYYVLSITLVGEARWLPVLVFLGGVSAASAMVIVTTLALAGMCLNHLILPASLAGRREPYPDLYRWLLWGRRLLIAAIIFAGFGFYLLARQRQGLAQIGLISFVAVAQFLPGVVGLFYWRRATRAGFIAGLLGGAAVWGYLLIVPLLQGSMPPGEGAWLVAAHGGGLWPTVTFWSLTVNTLLFVVVSLVTTPDPEEREAAYACCRDSVLPPRGLVAADSPGQFQERLAELMGPATAAKEVARALADLKLAADEQRPTELRLLRERIERNLSGLVGPLMARAIVDDSLRLDTRARSALADTVRFMEQRLDASQSRLQGLAAELDGLRRYHRQVLQELPLGVCALGPGREVVIWNQTMGALSGVDGEGLVGSPVGRLPEPWGGLLNRFSASGEPHLYKLQAKVAGEAKRLNLYKAAIGADGAATPGGVVILVEDITEQTTLEAELAHAERLASIGRLAAGVAHEIGNPLTGIASLAQNLKEETDPAYIRESIELVLEQTRRIRDIVQTLVTFSHGGAPVARDHAAIRLCDCIEEALRLVRLARDAKEMACTSRCAPEIEVRGDRPRLVQVFVNLLANACDASLPGDAIEVSVGVDGPFAEIEVRDEGEGIPEEFQGRVFEPFFTTKEPGQGTGLGLPMVYTIVQDHGGTVRIQSRAGEGTRVVIQLPLA